MTASVVAAIQVYASLFAAFVIYPYFFFRLPVSPGTSPAIRFWQLVLSSLTMWLAFGFLLSLLHSLTLTALAGVGVAGALGMRRFGKRPPAAEVDEQGVEKGHRQASRLLDAIDQGQERSVVILALADLAAFARRLAGLAASVRHPATALTALVVAYAAFVRLSRAMHYASPLSARGYSDLLAMKEIALNNGLFTSGVFPEGLHVTIALVSTLFFADPLNLLRFASPAVAFGLTLAAATLATELSRSRWAGLAAAVIVGLTALPGLGAAPWHLTLPIPEKAADAFFLLTLVFALRSFRLEQSAELLSLGMAVFVLGLFDPWLLPFAGGAVLFLAGAKRLAGHPRPAASLVKVLLYGAAASLLPLVLGRLLGHPQNAYLWAIATTAAHGAAVFLGSVWGAALSAALVLTVFLGAARPGSPSRDAPFWGALVLIAAATGALIWAAPKAQIATAASVGGLVGLVLAVAFCAWVFWALFSEKAFVRVQAMLSVFLSGFALVVAPLALLPPARLETPGAGKAYLQIARRFPRYEWTIISPTQQYSEVLGSGWHVELETFVRSETVQRAADPNFLLRSSKIHIQTPDTFLFVDLQPAGFGRTVTAADSQLPLPPPGAANVYQGTYGAAVDGRALAWSQAYVKAHPQGAGVFYRTPNLIVFRFRQPGP